MRTSGAWHVAYGVCAKPVTRRFAPKVVRQVTVWWDLRATKYCGLVAEMPAGTNFRDPAWDEAPIIYQVETDTIPELVRLLHRYAAVDTITQRSLYFDTPPHLRHRASVTFERPGHAC